MENECTYRRVPRAASPHSSLKPLHTHAIRRDSARRGLLLLAAASALACHKGQVASETTNEPTQPLSRTYRTWVAKAERSPSRDAASAPAQTAFRRGLVSITFDDGFRSDFDVALPILERHGARATFFVLTDKLDDPARVSLVMLRELIRRGHQIGSHTASHRALPELSDVELLAELSVPKQLLEQSGLGPILDFASPYGTYDDRTLVHLSRYYRSHRTTEIGLNTRRAFTPKRLRVLSMRTETTADQVADWCARAVAERAWLIIVYHQVVATPNSVYATTPSKLDAHLSSIAASGLPILTVSQAFEELTPQL